MAPSPFSHAGETAMLEPSSINQTTHDDTLKATTTGAAASADDAKSKNVRFADADIVEFEPTVWTATVASDGVPVGLSVNVRRRTRRRLDSFEGERRFFRIHRQEYMENGYLEPDERLDMLESAGHSIAVINHVERESVRINRERWESNEYDLLYQYGLGETAMLDLDDDDELLLSQAVFGQTPRENNNEDDDMDMLEAGEDDVDMRRENQGSNNASEYYYYSSNRNVLVDADVRYAMEEMDAYDTRKYEEWAWDYTTDCILGDDNDDQERDELPYASDAFDLPTLDFDISDMSSSPSDVSAATECMIVSCSTARYDKATKSTSTLL